MLPTCHAEPVCVYMWEIKNTLCAGVHRQNGTAPSLRPAYANLRLLMFLHFKNKAYAKAYAKLTRTLRGLMFLRSSTFLENCAKLTPSLRDPTHTDISVGLREAYAQLTRTLRGLCFFEFAYAKAYARLTRTYAH